MSAIGIDLGTTNSCVAARLDGKEEVLENDAGNLTTPSCVTFTKQQTLIGESAKNHLTEEPEYTIYSIKRIIGRKYDDPKTAEDIKTWNFKVVRSSTGRPLIKIDHRGENYHVEEISGLVLDYMRRIACKKLDEDVRDAVVTVPAYFNHMQRTATKTAAEMAGLKVLGMINEPTAAAIAFGLVKKYSGNRNILVYDFGGGTLDVTVLSIKGSEFDVKASSGDSRLGGDDLTNTLVNHFVQEIKTEMGEDITHDKRAKSKLLVECEKAKKELSFRFEYKFVVDNIVAGKTLRKSINRAKFVQLNKPLIEKTMEHVKDAIKQSGMEKKDINFVVPVGGSSRIPCVLEKLNNYFGKDVIKADKNPEQAIAKGAATYAAFLKGESLDQMREIRLSEVTPMSLGVRVKGHGRAEAGVIIERNKKLPATHSDSFCNSYDNQPTASIEVCQGEEKYFEDNEYLGEFELNITPRKKGSVKIDVEFSLNRSGILQAKATETLAQREGQSRNVRIDLGKTLENLDIQKLKQKMQNMILEEKKYEDLQTARVELEMTFSEIKSREEQHPKVIKRCEEIEKWLEQHKNAPLSSIQQKMKEITKYEEKMKGKFFY